MLSRHLIKANPKQPFIVLSRRLIETKQDQTVDRLEIETFVPEQPLAFDSTGRCLVFECRPETFAKGRKFQRATLIPCIAMHGL